MALLLLISLVLISWCSSSTSSSHTNHSISPFYCHPHESSALLGFLNSMTIHYSPGIYPYFQTWEKGSDCCGWYGVVCDPTSHHVVELELSSSGLVGTLDSNSSLFHLHHLRSLDLTYNDFRHSTISPMFASSFPFLESLDLDDSNFSGEVPLEISKLSKLNTLWLISDRNDQLTMKKSTFHGIISNLTHLTDLYLGGVKIDSTIPPSLTNLSSLTHLYLSNCGLRGELPANILLMPQLQSISLGGNKDLHANFQLSNWSISLILIDLSNVNFSSELPQSFPFQLEELILSGCSFYGQIPDWVWHMTITNDTWLEFLDLSNNKFNGNIKLNDIQSKFPNLNITTSRLSYLDISTNYLTGRVTSLPWNSLEHVDLSNNMFEGSLPFSLCNLTSLLILNLSNNSFKGEVPQCLLSHLNNNLRVLNLGSNNLSGTFPDTTFSNCDNLENLDLSNNQFEGLVPRFLTQSNRLEVLNLRSNKFLDEFPHWLGTHSQIRVLDLSKNDFFGPLPPSNESNLFPKLQVLDLSNNNFSGMIPVRYIESLRAMMNITSSVGNPEYLEDRDYFSYYSITLTFNGVELEYEKIITTLNIFDLSNNKFEGEIPNNIGKLVALHGLNLSHNQLIGHIPPSLGNLTSLNCLDLSSNKLTGQIPQELSSLSSLGVFNVSNNQLEGPIPNDNHLKTFTVDSYKGNPGLCGLPLPECGEHDMPGPQPWKKDNEEADEDMMSEWKVAVMGCGFGTFVSFAWGCYMLSIGRPLWLLKLVFGSCGST